MKLLILGGSNIQLNTISKAKRKGIVTVVSDYNEMNPGKRISDFRECVSTFDYEGTLEVAKKHQVDGILTMGSDQPVLIVSGIQEELGLPFFIDKKTALAVTNKKVMKGIFRKKSLNSVNYCFLKKDFDDFELEGINFPVVMKPLDSQGQRGIYKLYTLEEIRDCIDDTLSYSRQNEALVEEYYHSDEITVSGWVVDNKLHILTVTDRLKFEAGKTIGISFGHNFVSEYYDEYGTEIEDFSKRIVKEFNIQNGPVYFQFLIGKQGLKINEIACRIGGAFEDIFIPELTGVDMADMLIDYSLGNKVNYEPLLNYSLAENKRFASVQLFFVKPGKVKCLTDLNSIDDVYSGIYNIELNQTIPEIKNASERAGYFITFADSFEELETKIDRIFSELEILDEKGENMVISYRKFRSKVLDWRNK